MDAFDVRDGQLFAADVPPPAIAGRFGMLQSGNGDLHAQLRNPVREEGNRLAVRSAGAYGFVMNSNYNTRGRAAEVLVDSSAAHWVRRHGTRQELFASESLLPD